MDRRPHDRSGLGRVVPQICLQDRDCRAVRRQKGSAPMTATWSTARGDRTAGPGIVPGSANAGDPPPAGGSPGVSSMGPSLSRCTKQLAVPRFRRLRRRSVSGVGRRGVARQDCASVGVEVDVVEDASTRLIQRSTPSPSAPATGATIGQPGKDMSAAHGGRERHRRRLRPRPGPPHRGPGRLVSVATGWACNTSPQVRRICAPW